MSDQPRLGVITGGSLLEGLQAKLDRAAIAGSLSVKDSQRQAI